MAAFDAGRGERFKRAVRRSVPFLLESKTMVGSRRLGFVRFLLLTRCRRQAPVAVFVQSYLQDLQWQRSESYICKQITIVDSPITLPVPATPAHCHNSAAAYHLRPSGIISEALT